MAETKIVVGSLALDRSHNFSNSIIFWNMDKYDSWLVIGWHGLTFCHSNDNNDDPRTKHSQHIYNITGVDEI